MRIVQQWVESQLREQRKKLVKFRSDWSGGMLDQVYECGTRTKRAQSSQHVFNKYLRFWCRGWQLLDRAEQHGWNRRSMSNMVAYLFPSRSSSSLGRIHQHLPSSRIIVKNSAVKVAILIEPSSLDLDRSCREGMDDLWSKCFIEKIKEQPHLIFANITHDNVRLKIVVEITNSDGIRCQSISSQGIRFESKKFHFHCQASVFTGSSFMFDCVAFIMNQKISWCEIEITSSSLLFLNEIKWIHGRSYHLLIGYVFIQGIWRSLMMKSAQGERSLGFACRKITRPFSTRYFLMCFVVLSAVNGFAERLHTLHCWNRIDLRISIGTHAPSDIRLLMTVSQKIVPSRLAKNSHKLIGRQNVWSTAIFDLKP